MTFDLERLVRRNIRDLKPYSSARSEFKGTAEVFLDANENSFGSPAGAGYNRYPDPLQSALRSAVAQLKLLAHSQIFIGNGSDEAIDLLFRVFCDPGGDEVIACPPTYGMYSVSACINDIVMLEVPLTSDFQLDMPALRAAITPRTKLIFVCSPNNPTGNLMNRETVVGLAEQFDGIVVVDEAYVDFAEQSSISGELGSLPNLVVLQTFSKAWGMAGIRVGLAIASPEIIELMDRVKPPYNVSEIAQRAVLEALADRSGIDNWIALIKAERERLAAELADNGLVKLVYPSDANFLLVKVAGANGIYRSLVDEKIVVRNRSSVELCEDCLRITVGTPSENDRLISALRMIEGARGDMSIGPDRR
ncbi:MAG: histidinol-phosphate transaminase [Acidobacteriota bacterium]